jgi:hypothetical protein
MSTRGATCRTAEGRNLCLGNDTLNGGDDTEGDINGNGKADFQIQVSHMKALGAGDFDLRAKDFPSL